MYVRIASAQEYYSAFGQKGNTVFSSESFIRLVQDKAEMVRYAIGYDEAGRPVAGLIIGKTAEGWMAPFSAPFAELAFAKRPSLERVYDFISDLASLLQGERLTITLPPPFYCKDYDLVSGVLGNYADKCVFDYNYHYPLRQAPDMLKHMRYSARKLLKQALRNGLECIDNAPLERAYACVLANHTAKGYPVKMSLSQLVETSACVTVESFLVRHEDDDIAGAIVYHTTPEIAQVIYWGDTPGFSHLRPMNMLGAHLIQHYARRGFQALDLGPASSKGIPSVGLCRFKQSLGCHISLKPTLIFY